MAIYTGKSKATEVLVNSSGMTNTTDNILQDVLSDFDTAITAAGNTPAGSDKQVQFNDGGAFGGDAGLTFDKGTGVLTATTVNASGSTASTIASFDGSKNIASLATTTYPSLTELSYVKGVTSALQTQINAKGDVTGPGSSTDNVIPRFDGTTGKTLQQGTGAPSYDDSGNVTFNARILGKQGADVASATDITLGNGNYFDITGTTTIDTIVDTGWTAGSVVILQFDSSLTVSHNTAGGGKSFQLAGAVNFSATGGDTLTLVYDGTYWRELARTVI